MNAKSYFKITFIIVIIQLFTSASLFSQSCHGGGGSSSGHDHGGSNQTSISNVNKYSSYGGTVKKVGKYNIEMVFQPMMKTDPIIFFLMNKKGKPVNNQEITGKTEFTYSDNSTETAVLKPKGENELSVNTNSLVDSIANNPMVKMYLADSVAYNARAKMLKKMSYPMIGLGVNYSVINKSSSSTSMMNGKDMIMPMLAVTLPIYRKKYNSMIHEAELLRDASAKLSQSVINDLRSEFQQTIQNYNDANRRITLYAKQSDLANNSLTLLITSFSANGTDFEEILRMENQFLDYELKKIQAITDKNSLIAQFLYLTGFNF